MISRASSSTGRINCRLILWVLRLHDDAKIFITLPYGGIHAITQRCNTNRFKKCGILRRRHSCLYQVPMGGGKHGDEHSGARPPRQTIDAHHLISEALHHVSATDLPIATDNRFVSATGTATATCTIALVGGDGGKAQ